MLFMTSLREISAIWHKTEKPFSDIGTSVILLKFYPWKGVLEGKRLHDPPFCLSLLKFYCGLKVYTLKQ